MFRVRWQTRALDELTDFWVRADARLRGAITAATHMREPIWHVTATSTPATIPQECPRPSMSLRVPVLPGPAFVDRGLSFLPCRSGTAIAHY